MTLKDHLAEAARVYLALLLSETNGDVTKAAKIAGVDRTQMYRLFRKYGLAMKRRGFVWAEADPKP